MKNLPTSWNLEKIYHSPNDPKIESDKQKLTSLCSSFETKFKSKIQNFQAADFLKVFDLENEIQSLSNRLGSYFYFYTSLNLNDKEARNQQLELENFLAKNLNKLLFFQTELKNLSPSQIQNLIRDSKLSTYQNFFHRLLEVQKYILPAAEEEKLNLLQASQIQPAIHQQQTFFSQLKYPIANQNSNQTETWDYSDLIQNLASKNPKNRQKAYLSWLNKIQEKGVYKQVHQNYQTIIQAWVAEKKQRVLPTILSKRNLEEQIPDKAVETMLSIVQKNYPIFHRYLNLKAKKLKLSKLQQSDLNTPIFEINQKFDFSTGLNLLLQTLQKFDPKQAKFTHQLFEHAQVDVYPKDNKISASYCAYDAFHPSYILLNYKDRFANVLALAHETGHAWHAHLAKQNPSQVYYCGQALSETASIFNETLVNFEILESFQNQAKILSSYPAFLENLFLDLANSIFKQAQNIAFETQVYELCEAQNYLNIGQIDEVWNTTWNALYAGPVTPEKNRTAGWAKIHHFYHTPFYCYAYIFGNILSLNLYQLYAQETDKFLPVYYQILSSGGSKPVAKLLQEVGLDILSPDFYQTGLDFLAGVLDRLETSIKSEK